MEVVTLIIAVVALVIAVLAYVRAGGIEDVRSQVESVGPATEAIRTKAGDVTKTLRMKAAGATDAVRAKTADALDRLGRTVRKSGERPPPTPVAEEEKADTLPGSAPEDKES